MREREAARTREAAEAGTSSPRPSDDPEVARMLEEYMVSIAAGTPPDREALLARRPDLAAELAVCLDGLEFLQRAAPASGAAAAETAPGTTLGDFRLGREIGRGGMGVVYEAHQLSLGRRVALKVLPFAAVLDARRLQRFRNEATAAANLHHPHIVPVYAVGAERGVHYYAMQLIDGRTVEDVVREMRAARDERGAGNASPPARTPASGTPLSADGTHESEGWCRAVARLGADAADALQHAHQQGVVHRDVKPANLMIDANGVVWVTDFGLATVQSGATALTRTGDLIGTLRYMSPELAAAGRLPVDHRTDVYSLGATLYELLTLVPPVPGEEASDVLRALAHDVPVPPRRLNRAVSPALETIVEKAMAKDAAQRYATAADLAEDLERFVDHRPILARRPSVAARTRMWARRHRGLVAAGAVVLGVATAALAVGAVRLAAEERRTRTALGDAEANLRLARGAVDGFLVESGLEGLHEQPVPSAGQHALLETALRFYERDPASATDPVLFERRMSVLHALHMWPEALALLDARLARDPDDVHVLVAKGHMLWHRGENDEAKRVLRRALDLDPKSESAHAYMGNVLEDPAEALAELETAIRIQPGEPSHHVNKANALHNLGRYDESVAACLEAARLTPEYYGAYPGLGQSYMELRRWADAFAAYDQAVSLRPDISIGLHGRANALQRLDRLPEALASVERALKFEPTRADAHATRGEVLLLLGQREEALKSMREAVRLQPKASHLHADLGTALAESGDKAGGKLELEEAIRLDDKNALAHNNYGLYLENEKDHARAEAEYRRAIDLRPDRPEAHCNLASVLGKTRRRDEALEEYAKALKIDPILTQALSGRGNLRAREHEYEKALVDHREAVRIRPGDAGLRLALAQTLEHVGRDEEALEIHRDLIRLGKQVADAKAGEGRCLMRRRTFGPAKAAYEQALALDAKNAIALFGLGLIASETGDLEGAVRFYERSLESEPDSAQTHANLSNALRQLGNVKGALEQGREAIRLDDKVPEGHLNLGNALHDSKEIEAAVKEFRRAIELRPGFALAHNSLGCALTDLGKRDDAVAAYREAIRHDPDFGPAHLNLGHDYVRNGDLDGAIHEYGEAVRAEPDFAEARYCLGKQLVQKGHYEEAIPHLRRAEELGAKRRTWPYRSREWLALAERRLEMLGRLDDVVSGKVRPKDPKERTEFALVLHSRGRHVDAVAQYVAVFAEAPALETSLEGHRYNAACNALIAAAIGAKDAAGLRARALAWLLAELEGWSKVEADRRGTLEAWKKDPDLASVRNGIDALPAAERDGWRALWAGVDALLAKTPPAR